MSDDFNDGFDPKSLKVNQPNIHDELTRPAVQRLEAWMKEATDLLCYQPEIPMEHKRELVNSLVAFQNEINPTPLKQHD